MNRGEDHKAILLMVVGSVFAAVVIGNIRPRTSRPATPATPQAPPSSFAIPVPDVSLSKWALHQNEAPLYRLVQFEGKVYASTYWGIYSIDFSKGAAIPFRVQGIDKAVALGVAGNELCAAGVSNSKTVIRCRSSGSQDWESVELPPDLAKAQRLELGLGHDTLQILTPDGLFVREGSTWRT